MDLERLSARIDTVSEGGEPGEFEAVAASLGVATGQHGPVRFSEEALAAAPAQVPLLWQHDTTSPIGVASLRFVPGEGLVARGRLALGLQRAREAKVLLSEGAVNGVSLGFTARRSRVERGVRVVDAASVAELSLVTFPADPCARVKWVHRGLSLEEFVDPRRRARDEYRMVRDLQAAAAARHSTSGAW